MPQNRNSACQTNSSAMAGLFVFLEETKNLDSGFRRNDKKKIILYRKELQKRGFSVLAEDDGKKISRAALLLRNLSGSELKIREREEKKGRAPAIPRAGRPFFVSEQAVFREL